MQRAYLGSFLLLIGVTMMGRGGEEHERKVLSAEFRSVGIAQVDITPDYPIRLRSYVGRHEEATEVNLRFVC